MIKSNSSRVEELKPCPFCGDWPFNFEQDNGDCHIECNGCSNRTSYHDHMADAVARWNTRPESESVTAMREALEKIADHAAKLRKGTDDWFDLVEIEAKAREALVRIGRSV